MAIRFRCVHCGQLMSISGSKAGSAVVCTKCRQETPVPLYDIFDGPQQATSASAGATVPQAPEPPPPPPAPTPPPAAPAALAPLSPLPRSATFAPRPSTVAVEEGPEPPASMPREEPPAEADAFRIRKPASEFDDMDLTPMVDVTFLLLIFFMVTASFSLQKTLQVPPPDPDQKGAQQSIQRLEDLEATSIIVEIDERDGLSIDYEPLAEVQMLAERLRDKMRLEQKTELVVQASPAARHKTVVSVIDAANEVGMQRIRLASGPGAGAGAGAEN